MESYPVTIEVGVLLKSTFYYNKVSEFDNNIEFL